MATDLATMKKFILMERIQTIPIPMTEALPISSKLFTIWTLLMRAMIAISNMLNLQLNMTMLMPIGFPTAKKTKPLQTIQIPIPTLVEFMTEPRFFMEPTLSIRLMTARFLIATAVFMPSEIIGKEIMFMPHPLMRNRLFQRMSFI